MSQFVRDARITQLYEGANGIQALDLVGRKLAKDGGRAAMAFFNEVQGYLKERTNDDALNPYLKPLGQALAHLQQATMWFMQNAMAKPENGGAGATDYMHLFGVVPHGGSRARQAGRGRQRRRAEHEGQIGGGAVLHGTHAAGNRVTSGAHPG